MTVKGAVKKASASGLGTAVLIGGAIIAGAIALRAALQAGEGGDAGQFVMGGVDTPEEQYGYYPPGFPQEPVEPTPEDAALVDALTQDEFGTGSNSEGLYDPKDNPFPQAGGQYDTAGDISRYTSNPTPLEKQQADFITKHPVIGWSMIGVSLVPSWFSTKTGKYGESLAEAIRPGMKATKSAEKAAEAPFGKRAMSFLEKKGIVESEKVLGRQAAEAGVKVSVKKGLKTGAKIGIKTVPFIGLGAGIAIDKLSGIGTTQAIVRNVVGDIAGGVAGGVGTAAGPVGTIGGAVSGQIGGELAADWAFDRLGIVKKAYFTPSRPLTEEEKKGIKASFEFSPETGMFMRDYEAGIMSNIFRPSSQSVSANRVSASNMLQQANAWRAQQTQIEQQQLYQQAAVKAGITSPTSFIPEAQLSVMRTTAASSGRAATAVIAGREVTVGPTGNIYTQVSGSKYTYTPGPTTQPLGAALISSSKVSGGPSASQAAATKASIRASIRKATTGPKVSAKGKYTPSKSRKK